MATSPLYELNDPLLWPVIDAPDERARESAIEVLLVERARPVIAAILQRFRRVEPDLHIEDLEELSSLVAIKLIRKVRAAAVYEEHAVKGLADYLATLTYNALYDFRRQRYPERHRLKRNLRYLLSRDAAFALWETPASIVAGLARWRGQPPRPAASTRFPATAAMRDKARPAEAVCAILTGIGHPVTFESLVDLVAELWQVRDVVIESGDGPARAPEAGHDVQPDQLSSLEQREYLETLWSEIRTLPDHQRAALLLNLRDAGGANALTLFLLLNVASVAELARGAGVAEEELNAIWEQLPLDDLGIAKRLGLTRQQVINLRKSARTRLARRMAKWK